MISFVVPAYNEETELPACLRAIRTAAGAHEHEIIVVDDASTDRTVEIALDFGARLIPVSCRQIAAVRNAGARAAAGDILFFVDADTQISGSHVTAALMAMNAGCSGGSARVKMNGEVPLWAHAFLAAFAAIYFAMKLGVGAFIFTRRATFEAVGGFDEQYFAGEEAYLSLALKKHGPFIILPEPIVTSARKIRLHSRSFVLSQMFFIFFGGKRSLRKREKLGLWYDGRREERVA